MKVFKNCHWWISWQCIE